LTKSHGHSNATNLGGAQRRSRGTFRATMVKSHWNHSMQAMLTHPCLGSTRTGPVPSSAWKQLASSPHRLPRFSTPDSAANPHRYPKTVAQFECRRAQCNHDSVHKQHEHLVSAAAAASCTAWAASFSCCTWFLRCEESYASCSTLCPRSLLFPFVDKFS